MSQPSRCFVVAISLTCQEFCLHIFDRSGAIHSLGHNLHKSADLFTHLMYTLAFGSPDMLGFDLTFIDPTVSPSILTAYTVLCHIYISHLIHGRGMNSWLVKKGKQLYIVKDYWTHEGRKHMEEEILLKVKGLVGISQLVKAWTIQMEGADETTDWLQPAFLVGNIEFETHLHRHLLLTPVGDPLAQFSSLQELMSIFIDIIHGEHLSYSVPHRLFILLLPVHFVLVDTYNILHHDISFNNILLFICTTRWATTSHVQQEWENTIANKKFRQSPHQL
ncbi:hypothetical protein BKA83DRAFT_4048585 [Pisolithus microcarpus]|nr:hypothetical protein BKA83DRAFT_4048585 [Pisolithus microcarpus]